MKRQIRFKWSKQWDNEFSGHMGWHDYFNVSINEFPIFTLRRYDWFDTETDKETYDSTWLFGFFGFSFITAKRKNADDVDMFP